MQIYESYGYTTREAVASILAHNLYGLDIDDRAAQLSYFAVMMKARQYDRRFLTRISSRRWLTARQETLPGRSVTEITGFSASPCSSSIRLKGTLYSPRAGSPPAEMYRILRVASPSTSSRPAVTVFPIGTGVSVHFRIRRISGQ